MTNFALTLWLYQKTGSALLFLVKIPGGSGEASRREPFLEAVKAGIRYPEKLF